MKNFMVSAVVCAVMVCVFPSYASADWAYRFVVYSGDVYVVSDTVIPPDQIGGRIGRVTRYSDREGTYSGNFSNTYPKGTEYFLIKDMAADKEIAVQTADGTYVKAVYQGQYAGRRHDYWSYGLAAFGAAVAFFLVCLWMWKPQTGGF